MRLLSETDNRNGSCKTRTRVNSLQSNCCVRENYVKDVIEMNEKKCCESTRSSAKSSVSCPKLRSLSPINEDHSDSGEELQYGPGIVNKLRSKYMSMTLRDNAKKRSRPPLSNLRKASSLDNLLDDQITDDSKTYQISSVISCVNKLDYSSKESSSCVTVNFCADLKRTRSMEALLDEKSPSNIKSVVISKTKITNHLNSAAARDDDISIPLDSIVNEDVIIVENLISGMKSKERRHRSSPENTELPPPDVVKETLKIFESCQRRPTVKNWRQVKSESPKKSYVKPQLYPKPVLDNKVTIRTSEENSCGDNGIRRDHTLLSSIKVNFESNNEPRHRTTLSHTTCIRNDANSINVNVKTSAVVANAAPANHELIECSPPKKAFRENDFVVIDKCRNASAVEADCKYKDISKPVVDSIPPKQIGIIRPLVAAVTKPPVPVKSFETDASNHDGAKKTRPAERSDENDDDGDECGKFKNSCPNPSSELNVSIEPPAIESSLNKPSTTSVIKGVWSQQQNSMIFNFKDRKEVPDYIENDGLPLNANRNRAKRILDENGGNAGYVILGTENVVGEHSTAGESTTDSPYCCQETRTISRSPSPYNVQFKGDNVLIDGKSNLKKFPREKNLRIQFNDTCTIFEYPSEASLLEEDSAAAAATTDSERREHEPSVAAASSVSSNNSHTFHGEGSRTHHPLNGGSGLASYVPSKLGVRMNESFELGVTKCSGAVTSHSCHKDLSASTANRTTSDHGSKTNAVDIIDSSASDSIIRCQPSENIVNDYLKPAADGENIAWSEESIPDLLF